jgi:hypothetical protein
MSCRRPIGRFSAVLKVKAASIRATSTAGPRHGAGFPVIPRSMEVPHRPHRSRRNPIHPPCAGQVMSCRSGQVRSGQVRGSSVVPQDHAVTPIPPSCVP